MLKWCSRLNSHVTMSSAVPAPVCTLCPSLLTQLSDMIVLISYLSIPILCTLTRSTQSTSIHITIYLHRDSDASRDSPFQVNFYCQHWLRHGVIKPMVSCLSRVNCLLFLISVVSFSLCFVLCLMSCLPHLPMVHRGFVELTSL